MRLMMWAVVALVFLWPLAKVLARAGFSPWYCLLGVVPVVNLAALWVFATAEWPALRR